MILFVICHFCGLRIEDPRTTKARFCVRCFQFMPCCNICLKAGGNGHEEGCFTVKEMRDEPSSD